MFCPSFNLFRMFLGELGVFKGRPCGTVLDLYYTGLGVRSTLWKDCNSVSMRESLEGSTKELLAILGLPVHRYVSGGCENILDNWVSEEGCWRAYISSGFVNRDDVTDLWPKSARSGGKET